MGEGAGNPPRNKVARLLSEYDIDEMGDTLVEKWTAESPDRLSLRDLADLFNKRLLECRLAGTDRTVLDQDVERIYELLTADDVSAGVRTETVTDLEQSGVDVEALERDFVTYQAIRSYLTEWRGVEYESHSAAVKRKKDLESIQRLLSRTRTVTEERVENLRATDRLAVEDFDVILNLQVLCRNCGAQHHVGDFFENGGCDCLLAETEAEKTSH
mgnify:CR=1 FL=1